MKVRNSSMAALLALAMMGAPSLGWSGSLQDKLDKIQISGFVDASWSDNNTAPPTKGGITLDQVELDVEYASDNVGLRFDLESSADGFGATPFEQGYIYYTFNGIGDEGLTFTFGKFNAPIGWELLDAPDMYQFSHALVFDNALPTNLTGASLATSYGIADLIIYAANGTDTNAANTTTAVNTFGGRLGLTPMEGVNIGVSYLTGDNIAGVYQVDKFKTLDIDLTLELVDGLIIGAEYAQNKNWTAIGIKSQGFLVMAHYDFTDMLGITGRYGVWDPDTVATGKMTATTVALTAALGDGLGALVEFRNDKDRTVIPSTSINTYAFEMTYSF